jgi:hypothetical protein
MTKIAQLVVSGDQAKDNRVHGRRSAALRSAAALLALFTLAAPASARPFQQYLNGVCGPKICRINFIKVPAGSRLDVKNVSCFISVGGPAQLRASQLLVLGATPGSVVNAVTLAPLPQGRALTDYIFSANHPISAFASAQQRFQAYVEIAAGTFSQVACHISGDMVTVP